MKVFVYWNLHKKCFSVKCLEKSHMFFGKVFLHANRVRLSDVQFKVSAAGRARVLREKRKNVHAGVVGMLKTVCMSHENNESYSLDSAYGRLHRVTYNPYKYSTFVDIAENPVHNADYAILSCETNQPPVLFTYGS